MTTHPGPPGTDAARPSARPPARTRPRWPNILRHLAATAFGLGLAVLILPDLLAGLDRRSPFAQLVAFRPVLLAGLLAALLLLALITWFVRAAWPFAAAAAAVLVLGTVMVVPRVVADPPPTSGEQLTVLAVNVFEGTADVDAVAELVRAEQPDLIALAEAGQQFRARLAPLLRPQGYTLVTSAGDGVAEVRGVTAGFARRLGDVRARIGEESPFPHVELTGGGLGTTRFVAFHAVAPVPGALPVWAADLGSLQRWCAGPTRTIVAGDFNASLDHSALRAGMAGCTDAAEQRGMGLVPTWGPTPRTRLIGPQIDHVLSTTGVAAETFSVRDVPGSDHRAVLTRLRLQP